MPEEYFPAPEILYDSEKVAAFEALYQTALHAQGGVLDYALPYPKYEFLSYLADHKTVILHGSNNDGISEFVPMRAGMDANPHGNVMGVYGTVDGIWPIFFAVLNKKIYKGSMRNGVCWAKSGQEVDFSPEAAVEGAQKFYEFSLNAEQLDKPIWQTGTLYILPRAAFEQQRGNQERLTPEWASRVPVKPLARLAVAPADFPYLQQVSGHDDSAVLRMLALIETFCHTYRAVEELSDGYTFEYAWSAELGANVVEFIALTREHFPVCTVELSAQQQAGPVHVRLRGPETFKNVLKREMEKRPA